MKHDVSLFGVATLFRIQASLVVDATTESTEQGIDNCQAESICGNRELCFVIRSGGCGKCRNMLNNDGVGSLNGPLGRLPAVVDDQGRPCFCALGSGLYGLFARFPVGSERAICTAFAPIVHSGNSVSPTSIRPLRFARSMRFLTEEGAHLILPRGVRSCNRSS